MMRGIVQPSGDPTLLVNLRGPSAAVLGLSAVIDTGFNGYISLPPVILQRLQATLRQVARYNLADGTETATRAFLVEVEWHGQWRPCVAIEMPGEPLLGTAMLQQSSLRIDFADGGPVEIHTL